MLVTKRAVVLLSGGLDSTTVLATALAEGWEAYALSFDYGQRHKAELARAGVASACIRYEFFGPADELLAA